MASKHVLVIDDDPDIRDLLQMSLESLKGWQVTLAASGEEGARLARERLPDVILLDVKMPGMNGPSTFQELRAHEATREVPVVLLTADPQADARYQVSLQLSGMIPKPFNPYALPTRLAEILGW